jgi:hypothetical protein
MDDPNISLWDWLAQEFKQAQVRRTALFGLALLFVGWGILAILITGFDNGNGLVLFVLGTIFAVAGILYPIPTDSSEAIASIIYGLAARDSSIAHADSDETSSGASIPATESKPVGLWIIRFPCAVCFALFAQWVKDVQPYGTDASQSTGWILYCLSAGFAIWSLIAGDLRFPLATGDGDHKRGVLPAFHLPQWICLISAIAFAALAYLSFTIYFDPMPCLFLFFASLYWILAMTDIVKNEQVEIFASVHAFSERIRSWIRSWAEGCKISPWSLFCMTVFIGLVLLRTYQLDAVPPEMTSDHAEKLLDVSGIMEGRPYIFFANNGGREPLEFYLVALVETLFGTGVTFFSLKIVSVADGILALPFVYFLGKELAGRRAGLLGMVLVGVGFWPDVISRIGLRFPLSPLFSAITLYFFLRALRRKEWNSFIWAGFAMGIGLNGYTTMRIMPFVLALATLLFICSPAAKNSRGWALAGLGVAIASASILFLPMLRFASLYPNDFILRTITRIAPIGGAVADPIGTILSNTLIALRMFSENDGVGWFNLVPLRPALDFVTGAFFHLGVILAVGFAIRRRSWESAFLVLAIPILLLPSILALALPSENPSLTRASAAIPVVFLVAALALLVFADFLHRRFTPRWGWIAGIFVSLLVGFGAVQNLDLTLGKFPDVYRQNCENASEVGSLIKSFAGIENSFDAVHIIPYPYWVDGRLVSIYAGQPKMNFEIHAKDLAKYSTAGKMTIFVLYAKDSESLNALRTKFPLGSWKTIPSAYPGKDFVTFLVPPDPGVRS